MKKIINKHANSIIFTIISLLLLFLINNITFFKSIIFFNQIKSIVFINADIILSFLVIMILWYKKKALNKNLWFFLIIFIFIIQLLNNFFTYFNCYSFLLLYLYLVLISFSIYLKYKLEFEISIIIGVSAILLLFFFFGIANILNYSSLILVISIALSIYIMLKNKQNNLLDLFQNKFYSKSFVIFSCLFLIAILGGVGRFIHIWDEYSHWAFDAKSTILLDKLNIYSDLNSSTRIYPPILTLWHYFISMFSTFSEQNLYIGLSLFNYIYLMPVFLYIKKYNNFLIFLFTTVVYGVPFLFGGSYAYNILYADLPMGIVSGSILILYYLNKKNLMKIIPVLFLLFNILILIKPTGIVLAATILLLFFIEYFTKEKRIDLLGFIKTWKLPIIGMIIILGIWMVIIYITNSKIDFYDFVLLPETLKTDISLKMNKSFLLNFFTNVINSIDSSIIYGIINISLFAFLIIVFSSLYTLNKTEKSSNILVQVLIYIIYFCLTAFSLFVMFSKYEAENLASFGRYLNSYHIAILLLLLVLLSQKIKNTNHKKIYFILIIILINFPVAKLLYFGTDFKERIQTEQKSLELQNTFKIINDRTSQNSRIYIINQEDKDTIMPLWYARYYVMPRFTNASSGAINWKIKTSSNEWDLQDWGFTLEKWVDHLIKYDFDYVFLYSVTDEFWKATENFYNEDINEIKQYKLFKIENYPTFKLTSIELYKR